MSRSSGYDVGEVSTALALVFPRVPRRLVPRPRLLRRLDRLSDVTIIEALPGYGKRTLAAHWAEELKRSGTRVVWVQATTEPDGPASFHTLLQRGLHRVGLLAGPVQRPRHTEPDLPAWTRELARSDGPIVLVVEHAHLLQDPGVIEELARLVRVVHPIHLVFLTEGGQRLHDAAARHGLETNVLRADDLAITPDEVVTYAEAWGHQLTAGTAHLLHDQVGGWLLPMRLVLDATPAWADELATYAADEFLRQRVLPNLSEDPALSAAPQLAVPDRLTAALATVVLGEKTPDASHPVLEALHHRGLTWRMPRQDGATEWQMPTLVRRVLLRELGSGDPETARTVHSRVARALVDSAGGTAPRGLLRHARTAEDWSLLARVWGSEGWQVLEGEPHEFVRAFTAIPGHARQEHPSLALAEALADALTGAPGEAAHPTPRVESLIRHYGQAGAAFLHKPPHVTDPGQLTQLLTAGIVVCRNEGRVEDARRLAVEADGQASLARADPRFRLGPEHDSWFHLQWSLVELQDGNPDLALQKAEIAHETNPTGIMGASAAGLLAAFHAISGERHDAQRWLVTHEAAGLGDHWAHELVELPARIARALLALDRLDPAAAETELQQVTPGRDPIGLWPLTLMASTRHALLVGQPLAMLARLDHLRRGLPRHLKDPRTLGGQMLDRCSTELMLALGEVHRVQSRLTEHDELPAWMCAAAARHHLVTGEPHRAVRTAAAFVHRHDVHVRDRQDLLTTTALALREQGRTDQMVEALRQAHALGWHTGSLQPLVEIPLAARQEMLASAPHFLTADDLARLDRTPPRYPERVELIQLSPRELEVLHQTRRHKTAQDVAKALSVSVNTVKKQLASLYAKLDVHDRSAALQRAESLGLIRDSSPP